MVTPTAIGEDQVVRGDEVLERRGERVRGAALEVGASEGGSSAAAGKGVEVDLRLAEGARGDVPSPSASAAGIGEVLIDPVASPASLRLIRSLQHGVELDASQSEPAPEVIQRERNSSGFVPH